jgi:hypothetical protein
VATEGGARPEGSGCGAGSSSSSSSFSSSSSAAAPGHPVPASQSAAARRLPGAQLPRAPLVRAHPASAGGGAWRGRRARDPSSQVMLALATACAEEDPLELSCPWSGGFAPSRVAMKTSPFCVLAARRCVAWDG